MNIAILIDAAVVYAVMAWPFFVPQTLAALAGFGLVALRRRYGR